MAENQNRGLPDFDDAAERALWDALGGIEHDEPSPRLRQSFYRRLERATRRHWLARLGERLGFSGNAGWVTATACVLAGLGIGHATGDDGSAAEARLAALEQNVTMLNRRLILDRLEDDTPSKRLRGVMDAAYVVDDDEEVARALLARATGDRVPSVRSAAIDALGPSVSSPAVGGPVMNLLEDAASPIVQLALVDLVLRYGNDGQRDRLLALAERDGLHPDLRRHVFTALGRNTA